VCVCVCVCVYVCMTYTQGHTHGNSLLLQIPEMYIFIYIQKNCESIFFFATFFGLLLQGQSSVVYFDKHVLFLVSCSKYLRCTFSYKHKIRE